MERLLMNIYSIKEVSNTKMYQNFMNVIQKNNLLIFQTLLYQILDNMKNYYTVIAIYISNFKSWINKINGMMKY